MVHRVIGIIVLSFLFSMSCSEQESAFFDENINYSPAGVVQQMTFDEILQPRRMRFIGGRLYVSDFSNQPSFHILEPQEGGDLTYVKGEGGEGRGPGEFLLIEDFADADSLVYIFDGQQLKFVLYDTSMQTAPTEEIPVRTQGRPLAMYGLSDGNFASVGLFPDERFQVYSPEGDIIGRHGELIPFDESFTGRELAISWYSFSAAHPEEDYLYLFSSNSDHIEKYSARDGKLLQTVKGNENPYPRMKLETVEGQNWPVDDGSIYGYLWADADKDYIYALYSGELQSELDRFQADKIHVLDHELNLVAAYELDHYPFTMAADGHGGIYTVTNTADGAVFRYVNVDPESSSRDTKPG